MQIPAEEIHFNPVSFADPNARIFRWKGEIYRGVKPGRAELYRDLFARGLPQKWISEKLLVETELTDDQLGEYTLVMKHRRIPFVSFGFEWGSEMLKDAALHLLKFELALEKENLTLHDAHPWNILFEGPRPVFIDFGSIKPAAENATLWDAYDEFCRYFLFPLRLYAAGNNRIARAMIFDWERGVEAAECEALVHYRRPPPPPPPKKGLAEFFKKPPTAEFKVPSVAPDIKQFTSRRALLEALVSEVQQIDLPWSKTEWSNYYDVSFPAFTPTPDWHLKHENVYKVISKLNPGTITDVGSNRGWFAQMAATLGNKVVAFDVDESCVSRFYRDVRANGLPVLPLCMSFLKPSPAYGLNEWFPSANERFKSELVLGLAIIHHLSFKSKVRFEHIIAGLDAFCKRWLLLEFIPADDKYVREWWNPQYAWYTQENLEVVLRKYYKKIEILPSFHAPRIFFLCEK